MSRKALGRGLSALIPEPAPEGGDGAGPRPCPIELIRRNRAQPRQRFDEEAIEDLAASIRAQGVLQPLLVRPLPGGERGYELVAGERRWRAAQKAGLREVPVLVRELDDRAALEVALVENLQREDLGPLEEAEAFRALIEEHGHSESALARKLGKDRSTVANALRLLKLPQVARQALADGRITAGHGRALLGLPEEAIPAALARVVSMRLSVRQAEALVRKLRREMEAQASPAEAAPDPRSANVRDLEERLSRTLGTRVRLVPKRGKGYRGRIEISYGSLDELDRLLETLAG